MKYEAVIGNWSEGCPLTIRNIKAASENDALDIAARSFVHTAPRELIKISLCNCNDCANERHEEFRRWVLSRSDP